MMTFSRLFLATLVVVGSFAFSSHAVAQAPSDANIGAIVLAANQIDIDYGNLALTKSKNKEVKAFAQQMVNDHGAVQQSVIDLAKKLNLTPEEDETSKVLKAQSEKTMEKLRSVEGEDFDKFYIDNEVGYHKLVTDAIARTLIPSAHNSELKAALQGAQTLFLGHLEHAKNVQASVDRAEPKTDHK